MTDDKPVPTPCPFCREEKSLSVQLDRKRHPWPLAVECHGCGARGPENCFADLAIAAWNRRAPQPPGDAT